MVVVVVGPSPGADCCCCCEVEDEEDVDDRPPVVESDWPVAVSFVTAVVVVATTGVGDCSVW